MTEGTSPGPQREARPSPLVFFVGLSVLALALRWLDFTAVDLWQDEANEVFIVKDGFWDTLERVRRSEMRPPLRFYFLELWQLGGWGTHYLRLPSLAMSALAVPLLYLGARRLLREDVARVGALLMAGASFPISAAHFCRSYAMDLFVATLAFHAFALFAASPSRRNAAYYAVAITVAGWTSYFAGLILVLMAFFHLGAWRRGELPFRELLVLYAGPALAMAPLLLLMAEQWANARENAWHADGSDLWIGTVYLQVLGAGRIKNWTDFDLGQSLTALACLPLLVLGALDLWRRSELVRKSPEVRIVPAWFLVPSIGLFVFSLFSLGVFTIRTMLVYAPAYYLLVGAGLFRVPWAWLRGAAVCLFVAANVHGFATTEDLRYITHGSEAAVRAIRDHSAGDQSVVHAQHFSWFPMTLYGPDLDQWILQGRVPWNWGGAQVPADRLRTDLESLRTAEGFWFVQKRDDYHHPRERWLGQLEAIAVPWTDASGRGWSFRSGERILFDGLAVTHFERVPGEEGTSKLTNLRRELTRLRDDGVYPGAEERFSWAFGLVDAP